MYRKTTYWVSFSFSSNVFHYFVETLGVFVKFLEESIKTMYNDIKFSVNSIKECY